MVFLPSACAHLDKLLSALPFRKGQVLAGMSPMVAVTLGLTSFPVAPHSCPLPCSVVLFEHLYLTTVSLSSQHVHPVSPPRQAT